jgi:hypothetical protein
MILLANQEGCGHLVLGRLTTIMDLGDQVDCQFRDISSPSQRAVLLSKPRKDDSKPNGFMQSVIDQQYNTDIPEKTSEEPSETHSYITVGMIESASVDSETTNGVAMTSPPTNKVAVQLTKLRDANTKYKNLLKMAKERIEQQEQEIKRLKGRSQIQEARQVYLLNLRCESLPAAEAEIKDNAKKSEKYDTTGLGDMDIGLGGEMTFTILGIKQRIKVELEGRELNADGGTEEIWAHIEFESYDPDQLWTAPPKRSRTWKKFGSEAELSDYIRRDTGEPLKLPPYSLTPTQSAKIQDEAKKEVSKITEDFRRFRVKSEMARKQAEAQIRELQNSNVESVKRRIEFQNDAMSPEQGAETSRNQYSKIEKLRSEMIRQEAHWKEAYAVLMTENEALKSPSSQALVASQWRQRYETCLKEKEEIASRLKEIESFKVDSTNAEKYEMKYRDLKESFRLYRKKAKEIFGERQPGMMPNVSLIDSNVIRFKVSYVFGLSFFLLQFFPCPTVDTYQGLLRKVQRRFQTFLSQELDGQLLGIRSRSPRTHGRGDRDGSPVHTRGSREDRTKEERGWIFWDILALSLVLNHLVVIMSTFFFCL